MGSIVDALFQAYSDRAIQRAGAFLLRRDDALDLLRDAESLSVNIVGIEGYFLGHGTIEPSLANSIYFEGEDVRRDALPGDTAFDKARSFLLSRSDELYFDFDLGQGGSRMH